MKFKDYIKNLNDDELRDYAEKAGTSVKYIRIQLLPRKRVPRPELMRGLVVSAEFQVSPLEVLHHFYPDMFDCIQ